MITSPSRWLGQSFSTARLSILIFFVTYLIYALSPAGRRVYSDLEHGAEITRVALNVALDGEFAHPFYSLPTGPTAHTAPAYVFVYALVAKIFGTGSAGARALWALNVGFLALQLALLPVLSERLGLGALPGVLAAILGAVVQPYRVLVEWESLFVGLLLVVLCILTVIYFKSPGEWSRSLLLGLLWGIAILANPQSVLLLFVWSHIAAMDNSSEELSRARRAMLVVVAGVALACLPWFVRNYQRFHTVFFVRDNFGLELSVSNNPCARPTMLQNLLSGCHAQTHPNANQRIAGEVIDKGEIQFNHDELAQAKTWIVENPRAFARLTAQRFVRFWFPYLGGFRYAIPTGILTVLSFLGLFWMVREHRIAALLFTSTLFFYPLIHYVVQFEARYRYPIFWATLLPAAYAILKIFNRKTTAGPVK
jgi:hypothetical protein